MQLKKQSKGKLRLGSDANYILSHGTLAGIIHLKIPSAEFGIANQLVRQLHLTILVGWCDRLEYQDHCLSLHTQGRRLFAVVCISICLL